MISGSLRAPLQDRLLTANYQFVHVAGIGDSVIGTGLVVNVHWILDITHYLLLVYQHS